MSLRLFEALREGGVWKHYDLINISDADFKEVERFKDTLRDRGIYFEPSSNGNYVHFEVSCKSEDEEKFVDDYLRDIGINPYKEEELAEKKLSIEDLMGRLNKVLDDIVLNDWHFDNRDDAYISLKHESREDADWIWLLGEFSYNSMFKVADKLNKVLNDNGYPDACFDAEDSGRWCAVLWR